MLNLLVGFDYYPRGRVEITLKGKALIYMSPHIGSEYLAEICTAFEITAEPIRTLIIMSKLFEYRNILATLRILKVLNKRRTFNTRKPLLRIEKEDSITNKSIAAIGVCL